MKKQIIEFKENNYKQAIKWLDETIDKMNNAINILIANGYTDINIDTLKCLSVNKSDFINKKYFDKLKDICGIFGVDIEKYDVSKDENIRRMASSAIQYLYEASRALNTNYITSFLLNDKYVVIEDNVVKKAINAELNLKEHYTVYTENEKQNMANEILTNICKELDELDSNGISPTRFFHLFGFHKPNKKWQIKGETLKNINS